MFGSVLFFLGGLNTVFSVKAGVPLDGFHVILLISGASLFVYGAIQRSAGRDTSDNADTGTHPSTSQSPAEGLTPRPEQTPEQTPEETKEEPIGSETESKRP